MRLISNQKTRFPSANCAVSSPARRQVSMHLAEEWVLYFKNAGAKDTPILENIQALDVRLATNPGEDVVLHQIQGDSCSDRSFLTQDSSLAAGRRIGLAPQGGRSSNGTFPFFNLQCGGQGLIVAVGWSGQWSATLDRAQEGTTRLSAGMEKTHLVLHPGEEIRTPRILLLAWKGDRLAAHNRFRRLMLFHYVPQQQGRPLRLPIAMQCFDRYFNRRADWKTEAGQIAAAEMTGRVGCDSHWLDAAWFELGFPNGVGNWYPDPKDFPRGLRPVGDACHRSGLRFILWFEPERVAGGSQIARQHREFVFQRGPNQDGLFKLSDPVARRWLTDLLSRQIGEFGLDVYRNDFNIDPLPFWREADAPDRQGVTEIRYIEGLYAMWDELSAGHPGLWIDNCASGGRRIDLETCMRSVPLWRSDTSCGAGHADWDQTQTQGLSLYVPPDLLSLCPSAVDLRPAALAVLAERLDLVPLAQVAGENAGLERTEHVPGLHVEEPFLDDLALVLSEKLGNLRLVEVGMDKRPVQVQRGDELLRSRLFHLVEGLAEDVDDVSPAHGHDVVVVDHGVAVQGHASAVGAGPQHHLGALLLGLLPDLVEVGIEAGEYRDATEVGVEDRHAVPARVQTFAPEHEELAVATLHLAGPIQEHGRVVLLPIGCLFPDRADDVHVVLPGQLGHRIGRRARDSLGGGAAELLGQAGDVHALLSGRLQVFDGQTQLLVVVTAKTDGDRRNLHLAARQASPLGGRRVRTRYECRQHGDRRDAHRGLHESSSKPVTPNRNRTGEPRRRSASHPDLVGQTAVMVCHGKAVVNDTALTLPCNT
jgi:hypothetical protein